MTRDEALLLPVGTPLFHCHHEALFEFATDPVVKRWDYIVRGKPMAEIPTRLRLMRAVRGPLPQAITDTRKAVSDAWQVFCVTANACTDARLSIRAAARTACDRAEWVLYGARRAYDDAMVEHADEIAALHDIECPDCPWDGHTIFPGARRDDQP